jgi:hypothetical protein
VGIRIIERDRQPRQPRQQNFTHNNTLRTATMSDHTGFLENWQDALVFWSFVATTIFITWRIFSTPPKE